MQKGTIVTAKCPMCCHGQRFNTNKGIFVPCPSCYGRGSLIINHICACGSPISYISADGLHYCGEEKCLKDLRDDLKEIGG